MKPQFTAIYQKVRGGYVGWIEEIPGANTQGKTLREAKRNLKEALSLVLATNRVLAEKEAKNRNIIREPFQFSA